MGKFLGKLDLFGMIVLIAALGLYSYRGVWTVYQTAAAAAGGAMILAAIVAKRREIAAALKRRSTLFSLNSFISVLIILGILSLINFLGYRHNKRFDMTAEKLHSLSDQTLKVLDQIQVPVKAWAFFPGGEYKPAKDLLIEYRARNKKFEFEFVDPDKQPQVAKKYNVRVYGRFNNPFTRISVVYGTVVLESDGRTEKIEKQDEEVREEDITNALLRIIKPESKVIYFLTGHGEKSIDESEAEGYSMVKEGLEQERYQVKSLSLVREQKVPDDCAVLVVAGPATEPFPEELDKINQYLERGGSLFALLDPPPAAGLRDFLLKWSVEVGDDLILDVSGLGRLIGAGPAVPVAGEYSSSHKITERFKVMTFYPLARSVAPAKESQDGVAADTLWYSHPTSWAETDLNSENAQLNEGKDIKGPVSMAVAVSKQLKKEDAESEKRARLVVVGDSDFAANRYFRMQGNGNLFLNAVNWLAKEEGLISVRARNPKDRRVVMTQAQSRLLFYFSVLGLPLAFLLTGAAVWARRRR